MKIRSFIKNFLSKPLKFSSCFKVTESVLGKSKFGYIMCWHDLTPEIFKLQVEALYPSKPIPLDELVNRYKSGKSTKNYFAITFDDGVGSTVNNISKICLQMNWPVTFYLPVGYLNGESLPYHKVEFLSKNLPEGEYLIPKISKNFYGKKLKKNELIKFLGNLIYTEHSDTVEGLLKHFLEKHYRVITYNYDEFKIIHPGSADVLIGHWHPNPFTVFRLSAIKKGWKRVIALAPFCPYHTAWQNAFANGIIEKCDRFLAITNNY